MADDQSTQATGGQAKDFKIPDNVRAAFKDLIDLILGSESMNDEERQYWFDILPVMTPDQVQSLRGILENERSQLAAIDAKYAAPAAAATDIAALTQQRRESREQRKQQEHEHESMENTDEENILNRINEA